MRIEQIAGSFWRLQIGGWLVYLILIYITFFSVADPDRFFSLFYVKAVRTVIGFGLTCLLWLFYKRMVRGHSLGRTVAVVLVSSIVFGILWTAIESFYWTSTDPSYDLAGNLPRLPRVALDYAVTVMAWSAIYFGIKYWQRWQTERENVLRANFLAEKARLDMLRYQLNPHFLFNALNSIRASVDEDAGRAKRMITQLSEFLRHSLLSGETKEIPLGEELEAVENYLAIEQIRFEDRLEVEYAVEPAAKDHKVPCFLLNPLVENAIKHGFDGSPTPLRIRIAARIRSDGRLVIEVANSGRLDGGGPASENGTRIGLRNVRERLEKLFPGRSSFGLSERDGFVVARIEIGG